MLQTRTINWMRWTLLASLIIFLLTVFIVSGCGKHQDPIVGPPGADGVTGPTGPIGPTGPTGPTGSTPVVTVRHHVSIKHDSRSAPDSYRVKLNGSTLADTTFTTTGDGQFVPFVTFDTVDGDVVSFETPGRGGSNEAFVDSTEFVVN